MPGIAQEQPAGDRAGGAARRSPDACVDLEAVIESYVGGLVAFSPSGELLKLNRGAEEILGVRRGDVRSAPELVERARPQDEAGHPIPLEQTPFGRARRGELVPETLLSIRRPDGSRRWLIASAAPVSEHGKVTAVVMGFMDVTARREIRERSVRPSTSMSRAPPRTDSPPASSAAALSTMLRHVEELDRLESGPIAVEAEAVDVKASILDLVERLRPSADVARVRLELAPGTPRALVDPAHLHTMIASLLDNALKYAPASAAVVVACRGEGDHVVVEVRDAGPGIEAQELPRLFERFHRGSTAGTVEGLGLGLYVVRRLVEAQGGSVTARSELGKGSTFAVRLPAWSSR